MAQKLKPTEVSLEQAIVGLYRANPTAFGKRGINTLLAGSTLSMPETDTLKAITPKDIGTTLRSQTKDWRRYADAIAAASNAAAPRDPVAAHCFDDLYHEIFNEVEQADVLAALSGWLQSTFPAQS